MEDNTHKDSQAQAPQDSNIDLQDSKNSRYWNHPVTYVAFIILITTILLIAANVLGFDKGNTLEQLASKDFARGLITYLFSVGTIGVIMIMILATLLAKGNFAERIRGAKDILSILIGIFGTIIGFYFGSYKEDVGQAESSFEIASIQTPDTVSVGDTINISTSIKGGDSPFAYWIYYDSQFINDETDNLIEENLIVENNSDILKISIFIIDEAKKSIVWEKAIPIEKGLKN